MSKAYKPRQHPEYLRFVRKHPNRGQIVEMLEVYHTDLVKPLERRIERLETPWYRKLWERVDWWVEQIGSAVGQQIGW